MNSISRFCTELPAQQESRHGSPKPQLLSEFCDRPAYVLLGDPGEGKTTSFQMECEAPGEKGCLITARDFLALDPKPEWREKTLFIDGLDEVRAGQADTRTPFDAIRGRLDGLGKPRFRLSCRMADWLGANDRQHLNMVSPDGAVAVLRLEPLTDGDLLKIIENHPDIDDARAFLIAARERDIEPLLRNPQSLKMLIAAFADREKLPDSRREIFEIACQRLVLEHNEEHNTLPAAAPPEDLLDSAGRLCALQLLAGNAGYAIRSEAVAEDYPDLRLVDQPPDNIGRDALASKLFSSPAEGRIEPEHRQIAEYLGGRYLAKCIEGGLPSSRITALMAGRDGTVVTPLRGLSAWTAAHSRAARLDLIDRDPIGVGLYGDVRSFSLDEKRALLRALQKNPITVRSPYDAAKAFGALSSPGIEELFREILASPDRDDDAQWFTLFVVEVVAEGLPLPNLADLLMQVVRDDTRWSSVNRAALDAFMHCCAPQWRKGKLVALLGEVRSGDVRDYRNELLGRLLVELYPKVVESGTVWDYLVDGSNDSWIGSYFRFWSHTLLEESSCEQVAELLDELVQRKLAHREILWPHYLQDMPADLLARGLAAHGEKLEARRLYDWLGVNVDGDTLLSTNVTARETVGDWLAEHPDRIKDILAEGLRQAPDSDEFDSHVWDMEMRRHNAPSPPDLGLWCLEQAVRWDGTRPRIAQYLLDQAFQALRRGEGDEGLSEPLLIKRVARSPDLKAHLERCLAPPKDAEREERLKRLETEQQSQQEEWVETIRSRRNELVENRAPAYILYKLAQIYFGISPPGSSAKDGPARVREKLSDDDELAQAALHAFQGVIERDEVPVPDQILQDYQNGKQNRLCLPFLASLAEWERLGNDDVLAWPEERVQTALFLRHCVHWGDREPNWHKQLVELRPAEVAKAIEQIGASELSRGKAAGGLFWPLAREPAYREVAKRSCLPLLRAFPTRCREDQLGALDDLLWAAIGHTDQEALHALIQQKLDRKSMNRPQRIHWLAAARTAFGDAYKTDLEASIGEVEDEQGIRHLVDFLSSEHAASAWLDQFGIGSTERLLGLIGSLCGPEDEISGSYLTTARKASRVSHRLLNHLAASPLEQSSTALVRLSTEPALSRWRGPLRQALEDQRAIRRDAEYGHPTINQVIETLNKGLPANAADLAALILDQLRDIATNIRNSNTDDWRQYWNLDSHGKPVESNGPRHEDACRDVLLSHLRQRLPEKVQAEPEGHQANDARADIVVTYNDLKIPVEAKRNQHPKLWSAPKNQLIAKYAHDGPGIYLVFWFGSNETPLPPVGTRPKSPAELENRLRDQLTPEERRRIHIIAIDVERPLQTATE